MKFISRNNKKSSPAKGARPAAKTKARHKAAKADGHPSVVKQPVQWLLKLLGLSGRVKRRNDRSMALPELPAPSRGTSSGAARRRAVTAPRSGLSARDSSEAREMRAALAEVLDQHVTSRKIFPHLNAVERTLRSRGLPALSEMPLPLLQTALRQLEGLVPKWTSQLAELRSRLSLVIIEREQSIGLDGNSMKLSDFGDGSKVHVGESNVTTFMEVHAEWEKSLTGTLNPAPEGASQPVAPPA